MSSFGVHDCPLTGVPNSGSRPFVFFALCAATVGFRHSRHNAKSTFRVARQFEREIANAQFWITCVPATPAFPDVQFDELNCSQIHAINRVHEDSIGRCQFLADNLKTSSPQAAIGHSLLGPGTQVGGGQLEWIYGQPKKRNVEPIMEFIIRVELGTNINFT